MMNTNINLEDESYQEFRREYQDKVIKEMFGHTISHSKIVQERQAIMDELKSLVNYRDNEDYVDNELPPPGDEL